MLKASRSVRFVILSSTEVCGRNYFTLKKMVQSKIVPIDVAFLTYDPKKCSDTPVVKQDNSCVVGYEELKRHREMKRREKDAMGKLKVNDVKIK